VNRYCSPLMDEFRIQAWRVQALGQLPAWRRSLQRFCFLERASRIRRWMKRLVLDGHATRKQIWRGAANSGVNAFLLPCSFFTQLRSSDSAVFLPTGSHHASQIVITPDAFAVNAGFGLHAKQEFEQLQSPSWNATGKLPKTRLFRP
jgi:hypothetical protein